MPVSRTDVGTTPRAYWRLAAAEALDTLGSGSDGLTDEEASRRLVRFGPNELDGANRTAGIRLLLRQFESPIVLLLVFATLLSFAVGDATDATIILAIVVGSALLGFFQERGATRAVDSLLSIVQVEAEVRRGGAVRSVPVRGVVPGDVVVLNAGDVIPGDCVVLSSEALQVDESALTGEGFPAEKSSGELDGDPPLAARTNCLFLGTHVSSGQGEALVVATGGSTEIGGVSARLRTTVPTSGFQRGITSFGLLLVRATVTLTSLIFVINLVLSRPFVESMLFSLALAVGLTPQLLPAIVAVSLARGARLMARERVIVRRLESIEDFGSMEVLCTDKTGTLTQGAVTLFSVIDPDGNDSERVLRLASINARLQTGFTNPIDQAILARRDGKNDTAERLDEVAYDFTRKRLSVLVADDGASVLVTKGALDNVLAVCTSVENADGGIADLAPHASGIRQRYEAMSADGLRVLGLATRSLGPRRSADAADETSMTFCGFLTFSDPPKEDVGTVLADLSSLGITLICVTGDNRLAAAHVARVAGLDAERILTGPDLDRMSDEELAARVEDVPMFAEVEPAHKERIVLASRRNGRVTGFLGDGINDAPALHAADVGISVNTAVDVAKQSAAIVLLEKDLAVLSVGVRLGRQTFANTLKYIFVTTSANFGNMLSMAGASAFLPFLPLLPRQILLLNFLTDLPGTTIATDAVDPERLQQPQTWDIRLIRDFMILFGVISSCFDVLTFVVLRAGFGADASLFHTGWFVESVATELAVMLVLRTRRLAIRSRPSTPLLVGSIGVMALTIALPYTFLADPLGLVGLTAKVALALVLITVGYVAVTEVAKAVFWRHHG
jgi:P-type Mg2+ transporter